jgi:CheY-like chemotaxis protein
MEHWRWWVDDDPDAREAAAGLLAQWGWRVITATDGDEALTLLGDPAPPLDAVISDYRLPEGELGTQVIDRIRATCGENVLAIVVSGDVTAGLHEAVQSAGLQQLHKPLQAATLRTLLHHLRRQREAVDSV